MDDEVQLQPASEATTQVGGIDGHILGLDAERRSGCALRALLELGRTHHLALAVLVIGGEVHGLQRSMRLHRRDVLGFHHFRSGFHGGSHIACGLADGQWLGVVRSVADAGKHAGVVNGSASAFIPHDGDRLQRLFGVPVRIRHHHHIALDVQNVLNAGHGLGLRRIKGLELAANHRALRDGRVHHARQGDVDTVLGGAIDFDRGVHALGGLTNDLEVLGVFEGDFFRHRQFGRIGGQRAVSGFFAARAIDHTFVRTQGATVHVPTGRGGADEHFAHLGASDTQLLPAVAHRGGTTGDLGAQQVVGVGGRVCRCVLHRDLRHLHIQLFGDEHGHGGEDALAHLGARGQQGDGVVVSDVHPGIGGVHRAGCLHCGAGRKYQAHEQAPADGGGCFQKFAA